MKLSTNQPRRTLVKHLAVALSLNPLFMDATSAQNTVTAPANNKAFPDKPIRIIVPFGAGGIADLCARIIASKLSESLGQSVVVENKPGAGGIVAAQAVARAEPDGHTLLLTSNATAISAALFKSLPYQTVKDFSPISSIGFFDLAVISAAAGKLGKLNRLDDWLKYARANPGKLNMGTINIGSSQHLAAELFKSLAGIDFQIVPFNGTPALMTALRGGDVDIAIEILGPVLPQTKSGQISVLATLGEQRNPFLANVPTAREAGSIDISISSWNGLAAPAKTPKQIIERLNQAVKNSLDSPEMQKRLADLSVTAKASSAEQATDLLSSEIVRWGQIIEKAGIAKQ